MTKYTRKLPKPLAVDTPQMRAAVNLVLAVESGNTPDIESLKTLRDAFLVIFGGKAPVDIFGHPLGLVPVPGRPKDYGFTPADIVSAFIEQQRRALCKSHPTNALETAKQCAAKSFVHYSSGGDVERAIDRDWANGKSTVSSLSDKDLCDILDPYKISA